MFLSKCSSLIFVRTKKFPLFFSIWMHWKSIQYRIWFAYRFLSIMIRWNIIKYSEMESKVRIPNRCNGAYVNVKIANIYGISFDYIELRSCRFFSVIYIHIAIIVEIICPLRLNNNYSLISFKYRENLNMNSNFPFLCT